MNRTAAAGLFGLGLLAGCAGAEPPVVDSAQLRPGELAAGAVDPDVDAVQYAAWAFADPSRTYGRPADAARAVAAMDYIAGALSTGARWGSVSSSTRQQLLAGRAAVRAAVGVVPGTSSQVVVDRLSEASAALASGDESAALQALSGKPFDAPGGTILARLAALPYLRDANVSTAEAADEIVGVSGGQGIPAP